VADGSLRVLKSVDWFGTTKMLFSPDGRYLAMDLPADESTGHRGILVLALDGSREVPAVVHPSQNAMMGWSPDGKHLLFASDRTGSMGIWALSFAEGKPGRSPSRPGATHSKSG
jgi:Tol biopolymer transport system component